MTQPERVTQSAAPINWPAIGLFAIVLLVMVVLGISGYRSAKRAEARDRRSNALHQIGMGIHNYADVYGHYPTSVHRDKTGRPLCSWRFNLIPFMGMSYLMDYAERWDDPQNRWRSMTPHPDFCFRTEVEDQRRLHTNVVAITGPGTPFGVGDGSMKFSAAPGDTIIAIEVANSGTHWMAPGDLSIDEITPEILKGIDGDGVYVLCSQVSIYFLSPDAPVEVVKKLCTVKGAEENDFETALAGYWSH